MAQPRDTLPGMKADEASNAEDPVVAAYLKDVDRTLLRSNLRLSAEDRIRKLQDFVRLMATLQEAGRRGTR
jgi:23S rRNA A2030 N6-methylase RlmJ